jgi:hypothetical protein
MPDGKPWLCLSLWSLCSVSVWPEPQHTSRGGRVARALVADREGGSNTRTREKKWRARPHAWMWRRLVVLATRRRSPRRLPNAVPWLRVEYAGRDKGGRPGGGCLFCVSAANGADR